MGKRKNRPGRLLVSGVIILIITLLCFIDNELIGVSRYDVEIGGLPRSFVGFKILHLSDLHGKEFGSGNRRLLKIIERENPDIIVATGDMIDSIGDDGSSFLNLLKGINGRYPVYFSLGNHEQAVRVRDQRQDTEVFREFIKQIREAGGIVLDNERAEIKKEDGSLHLYGLTSMLYHYTGSDTAYWEGSDLKADFLVAELGRPSGEGIDLLLAHNPKYFAEYARWGADIVLAGHVHGGIVRLPFLGGIFSPDRTLFPEYQAGIYKRGDAVMLVSRGLGSSVIPLRLFNRPEVVVITLK
ncbi:metallophosphoesterase [Thermacetogenium phaeum DSM 12270]|uniref:Metallophosphoesterase n=1 Tax=Thermacetogenium phaeum (strain ATCC BAA-254 / DSM 26808 / PB) TaxID=1089553 RepID=K4LLL0_THEPS|nr:metallophosphoesterase [Thermacetogenium phaeum]AFV12825.1 metallophosphoesterase [Thermacetogenium phaeum DSM 12270]